MQKRRILLVDDEPPLLRLMQVYLERLGFQTVGFASSPEALSCFEQDPEAWDIVVADLTLADLGGDQLGLRMVSLNPRMRVLLCSGYPYEIESLPAEVRAKFASLQKPFAPAMLACAIEDLCGRE